MFFDHPNGAPQLVVLILASTCFASFLWGPLFVFKRQGLRGAGAVGTSIGIVLMIVCQLAAIVLFYRHDPMRLACASVLYGLCIWTYWTAVAAVRGEELSYPFTSSAPAALITRGPFAWVRHPFYTSYLVSWVAGWIACGQWWLLLPMAIMAWLFARAANVEEEAFLRSDLVDDYRAYQRVTGRFLPRLRRPLAGSRRTAGTSR